MEVLRGKTRGYRKSYLLASIAAHRAHADSHHAADIPKDQITQ